jgi:hypothetical protein
VNRSAARLALGFSLVAVFALAACSRHWSDEEVLNLTPEEKAKLVAAGRALLLAKNPDAPLPSLSGSLDRMCGRELVLSAFTVRTRYSIAVSGKGCPEANLREAARKIMDTPRWKILFKDKVEGARVKVDVLSSWRPLPTADRSALAAGIEPGVSGLVIVLDGAPWYQVPEEVIYKDWANEGNRRVGSDDLAVKQVEKLCSSHKRPRDCWKKQPVYAFHTASMMEETPGGAVVDVFRATPAPPAGADAIDGPRLVAAARAVADNTLVHQTPDGRLGFLYYATRQQYDPGYDLADHLDAIAAFLAVAERTGDPKYRNAALGALAWIKPRIASPEKRADLAYVRAGDRNDAGLTALLSLALSAMREPSREWDPVAGKLAAGLLALTGPDGAVAASFDPGSTTTQSPVKESPAAGVVLLALVRRAAKTGDAKLLDAASTIARRAAETFGIKTPVRSETVQALAELARVRPDGPWTAACRAMADRFAAEQYRAGKTAFADYVGGFRPARPPRTMKAADGAIVLAAAQAISDPAAPDPAAGLARGATDAARFLLRRIITARDGYYIPAPEKALGGVRGTPIANDVRLGEAARAIQAFLAVEASLRPASPPTSPPAASPPSPK